MTRKERPTPERYDTAIADINARLKEMDMMFDIGDMTEDAYKATLRLYTQGVILRAMMQSSKTIRGIK